MHHSLGRGIGHPARSRNQQDHLQKGQPTRGPPASLLGFAGHLPSRAEWLQDPSDNLSAQVPSQWHKPTWRQTHLSKGGHFAIHHGGARMESITPWQLPLHPDGQPHQGYSA